MRKRFGLTILSLVSLLIIGCDSSGNGHIHEYSEEYSSDSSGHYNFCKQKGCKNRTIIKPHSFDSYGKCKICGYTGTPDDDVIIENYDTYVGTNNGHYKIDSKGNRISSVEPHVLVDFDGDSKHETKVATCTMPGKEYKKCTICGKIIEYTIPPISHDFHPATSYSNPVSCTNPGVVECWNCGYVRESDALGHELQDIYTGAIGIEKECCIRDGCKHSVITLDIEYASGWNKPLSNMYSVESPLDKSDWNVSGIIDDGYYDIEIECKCSTGAHYDRKWYNMAKPELCVDNIAEDNPSANSSLDLMTEDDYRYYFKINDSNIINPNVYENWGELGFNESEPKYGIICRTVQINNAYTFSLCHGNIGCYLIISRVRLIKLF